MFGGALQDSEGLFICFLIFTFCYTDCAIYLDLSLNALVCSEAQVCCWNLLVKAFIPVCLIFRIPLPASPLPPHFPSLPSPSFLSCRLGCVTQTGLELVIPLLPRSASQVPQLLCLAKVPLELLSGSLKIFFFCWHSVYHCHMFLF